MEKAKRILFFGDSITDSHRNRAISYSTGIGYVTLIKAILTLDYAGQFEVLNRGIAGNRTTDLYARFQEDVIELAPDYLNILVGVNDVWEEYVAQKGVCAEKTEEVYRNLIREIKSALPNVTITLMEPFLLPGAATKNTEEHPKRWDYMRPEVELRAKITRKLAEEFQLTFIPLQEKFDKLYPTQPINYFLADGIHPSAAGHEVIKRTWLETFHKIR